MGFKKIYKVYKFKIKLYRYIIEQIKSQYNIFIYKYIIKNREVCVALNIAPWKRKFIKKYYRNEFFLFLPLKIELEKYDEIFKKTKHLKFLIWGYPNIEKQLAYIVKNNYKIERMEDGFIRSFGLGAAHTRPLSLVRDKTGLYFNKEENDLKKILNNYNFFENKELIERAKKCIQKIEENSITKYNSKIFSEEKILGEKSLKKRILVIGQVESDASLKYGMDERMNNNDLVKIARLENPTAEIFYKPHPDVLRGYREMESNPDEVKDIAIVLTKDISISNLLSEIDEVYTMTSLVGFEALLRKKTVNVFGKPFYAGWGLTNDRCFMPERRRRLSLEELFAGSYILYPNYFNKKNENVEIEEIIEIFNLKNRRIKWKK